MSFSSKITSPDDPALGVLCAGLAELAIDLDRNPRAQAFRTQLGAVGSPPKLPEWEQIATRMAQAAEQVVRGAAAIDPALAALDRDVDRMLEKRRWMLDHGRLGEAAPGGAR